MEGIIRTPTVEERKDFIPIIDPAKKGKNAKERFEAEMAEELQKAIKKGTPFCEAAARADFNDYYDEKKKIVMRKFGYLKADEIKPIEMDWAKYSDIKNFELVKEDEVYDNYLSKRHNVEVFVKKKEYKHKDYAGVIAIMESGEKAVQRAKELAGKK